MEKGTLKNFFIIVFVASIFGGTSQSVFGQANGGGLSDTKTESSSQSVFQDFMDALTQGSFNLNLRLRAEVVEQDATDTAQAYTERIRIGYGTKDFHGFSFYFDLEDIHSIDPDLYNAANLNNQGNKAIVADPEDTELNQFFLKYVKEFENLTLAAILGRQRVKLDNDRFVGNVGWRQNEQTLDAYTFQAIFFKDFTFTYSYVDDVNRIFGPDSGRDLDSDSHVINFAYDGLKINDVKLGKLVTFAYLLDVDAPTASSDTVGFRFSGKQDLNEDLFINYDVSYAHQVDAENNPNDYKADYYFLESALGLKKTGSAGLGYEVLGSDSGQFAFATPLATLHKFNGWADVFLATPQAGLEDLYLFVNADLPWDIKSRFVYHLFFSEDRSSDLGEEFDASFKKAITANLSVLAKTAIFFNGNKNYNLANRQKFWLQMELVF